ncbi:MAG: hypothetical protein ACD_78C00310G0002 [uncultured bacterium (gcode 4)]|uniref:Uncharacterized protein n=1 Tax=uncultured bacterium (gcode 4) TaxID=1234023 RepID=K1YWR1_9BACT|nr:MAG: hypothetical protein ACD_78C00310G0002 [uncultured bacterium (gcode 4)]
MFFSNDILLISSSKELIIILHSGHTVHIGEESKTCLKCFLWISIINGLIIQIHILSSFFSMCETRCCNSYLLFFFSNCFFCGTYYHNFFIFFFYPRIFIACEPFIFLCLDVPFVAPRKFGIFF